MTQGNWVNKFYSLLLIKQKQEYIMSTSKELNQVYFMLVKTTTTWLQIPVKERFEFQKQTIVPILAKYPSVKMRFFDFVSRKDAKTQRILSKKARIGK
jgi:hypothetical protein